MDNNERMIRLYSYDENFIWSGTCDVLKSEVIHFAGCATDIVPPPEKSLHDLKFNRDLNEWELIPRPEFDAERLERERLSEEGLEAPKEYEYFCKTDNCFKVDTDKKNAYDENIRKSELIGFLNETDWKVMRHIRQKALGIETTLSEEEYLELETERHNKAIQV